MLYLAACLALAIGLCLGLFGAGGGILLVPTLVYVLALEPKRAIVTSLLVIGVTSLVALIPHARAGRVKFSIAIVFGIAGMAGAYAGGRVAKNIPAVALLVGLAVVMVLSSLAMLRGRRADGGRPMSLVRGGTVGSAAGFLAGMVGAGGGFIVVPALVFFGGLPMTEAIGTSLLVVAMQSIAGATGHLAHTPIDLRLAGTVGAFAVLGSFIGARISQRVSADRLRVAFAWLIAATAMLTIGRELVGLGAHPLFAVAAVVPIPILAAFVQSRRVATPKPGSHC